jgi:hypothetical protein
MNILECPREILNASSVTIGIFSFKAPIAKKVLTQIKLDLENNGELKALYPTQGIEETEATEATKRRIRPPWIELGEYRCRPTTR